MAQNTPESDLGSIECFQNYTAPEVFIQGLAGIVNQQDVESMIRAQKQMLQRFEKTNEMLLNCNSLSVSRLKVANAEFKKHTQLLVDMRKDLDNIFKRIRVLKTKLNTQYPQAFQSAVQTVLKEEDEEDVAVISSANKISNEAMSGTLGKPRVSKSAEIVSSAAKEQVAGEKTDDDDDDDDYDDEVDRKERERKRRNSSSSDSANGNTNESSPYSSDTG